MMRATGGLIAGLLFGAGLMISGMINPAKVIGFLDLAGDWDPSLAFVMAGGVVVTALGYAVVLRRERPIFEAAFSLPTRRDIDLPLLLGASIFGVGWGLAGYCPGPALASLTFGHRETFAFVAAMIVGMIGARRRGTLLEQITATKKRLT
jgi:uncharacterized membrane protein YedE/YeeE